MFGQQAAVTGVRGTVTALDVAQCPARDGIDGPPSRLRER